MTTNKASKGGEDRGGNKINVKVLSRIWTVPVEVVQYSCCGDILTEDGFCHTCWEHCR